MKKAFLTILCVLSAAWPAFPFRFELKGAYLMPSDKYFQDIYGGGPLIGAEFGASVYGPVELYIEGNYFKRTGKLTYTEEATSLRLIPLGLGIRANLVSGKISAYVGGLCRIYLYQESNPLGTADKNGVGIGGNAGTLFQITDKLSLDLRASYVYCKIKSVDTEANVGGIELGAGINYIF